MATRATPRKTVASVKPASMEKVAARALVMIRKETPELKVERHWGIDWCVGRDLVCAVGAFTQHVGVQFWRGSTIPDPGHLLEGTGKNLRHVKLRTLGEADSPRLAGLVRRAVALDQKEPVRPRTGIRTPKRP